MKTTTSKSPVSVVATSRKKIGRVNPNIFRLTIFYYNHQKKNDFKTTENLNNMNRYKDVYAYVERKLQDIKKAYWNGYLIIEEGQFIPGWEDR